VLRAAAIAERAGVPSVSIVTTPFMQQAAVVSKGVGLPSLPIAEYPGVPMTDGSDAVTRKIEALLPQIVAGLAGARDVARAAVAEPGPRDVVARGTLDEIQELYHRNLWSDGLPVIPPTVERVERFLSQTRRRPDEVIGRLLPENRAATVWSIAVNGVMAGCRPEYMPLLVAIVEAIAEPIFRVEDAGSTPGWEPLVIVSGPIARRLDLNHGQGVMRVGRQANTSLGRFVRPISVMSPGCAFRPARATRGASQARSTWRSPRTKTPPPRWDGRHLARIRASPATTASSPCRAW
jgi:hypothetical protein